MQPNFDNLSPEKQRQLREATRELNDIAIHYAVDVFVASRVDSPVQGGLNSATGVFLQVGKKTHLATASHVLTKFEERVAQGDHATFQVAKIVLYDPLSRVSWREHDRDLVLLEITAEEAAKVNSWIYQPHPPWPPPLPAEDSLVITAGFPVEGRSVDVEKRAVELKALQCMMPVRGVGQGRFYCPLERDQWYDVSGGVGPLPANAKLGGMSGAPVFAVNKLAYPLVGIVTEYSSELDMLVVQGLNGLPSSA